MCFVWTVRDIFQLVVASIILICFSVLFLIVLWVEIKKKIDKKKRSERNGN